jgi:hypothetical protein
MKELDDMFLKELPKNTASIGKTTFSAMGVIENYECKANMNKDLYFIIISWIFYINFLNIYELKLSL